VNSCNRFGPLSSFIIPKNNAMALVDFCEPSEARQAYRGLAYRAYKHQPLYLEWAPLDAIDAGKLRAAKLKDAHASGGLPISSSSDGAKGDSTVGNQNIADDNNAKDYADEYFTLFIKNLNFSTNEAALRTHLLGLGVENLRTVSIQKKSVPARSPSELKNGASVMISQGYGFAEFSSSDSAKRAQAMLHGSILDSHALEVKPSTKRLTSTGAPSVVVVNKKPAVPSISSDASAEANKTKLIVRNVAFQATRSELLALFSSFGAVKRVRIPKKMGGEHRGFAFVEFASAQEANTAMTALSSTHMYGRHLVLEWAKEEDDMEGCTSDQIGSLRKRARMDEKAIMVDKKKAAARLAVDLDAGNGLDSKRRGAAATSADFDDDDE
jgi:multiple RNA-binding domain-containing protein 1